MAPSRQEIRAQFFKDLKGLWPLAKGTLTEVAKPCIRPHCTACQRGTKHPAFIFTFRQGGVQRCRYVPRALVPLLRQAIANGHRLEDRVTALGEALLLAHRAARKSPLPATGQPP